MAIKITVSNRVKFNVEGTLKDEEGKDNAFKFGLLCNRITAEQHRERTKGDINFVDFFVEEATDWFDVKDADNKPLEFNEANLRQLLDMPGLAALAYFTYMRETGAKQKN
jgi:hypothetical protein